MSKVLRGAAQDSSFVTAVSVHATTAVIIVTSVITSIAAVSPSTSSPLRLSLQSSSSSTSSLLPLLSLLHASSSRLLPRSWSRCHFFVVVLRRLVTAVTVVVGITVGVVATWSGVNAVATGEQRWFACARGEGTALAVAAVVVHWFEMRWKEREEKTNQSKFFVGQTTASVISITMTLYMYAVPLPTMSWYTPAKRVGEWQISLPPSLARMTSIRQSPLYQSRAHAKIHRPHLAQPLLPHCGAWSLLELALGPFPPQRSRREETPSQPPPPRYDLVEHHCCLSPAMPEISKEHAQGVGIYQRVKAAQSHARHQPGRGGRGRYYTGMVVTNDDYEGDVLVKTMATVGAVFGTTAGMAVVSFTELQTDTYPSSRALKGITLLAALWKI
ncbi:hypothetical protein EDB84DRAFT_1599707 [Lactarius hengduanensis]|nr:hypothetical protein EDB84DRAFT_1599707 [Lactarius hengduanensis]